MQHIKSIAVLFDAVQLSVEAELEQPFFVHGAGWSSCDPARTHARYQLLCRQLSVGDTCISLATDDFDVTAAADSHLLARRQPLDNSRSPSLITLSPTLPFKSVTYKKTRSIERKLHRVITL